MKKLVLSLLAIAGVASLSFGQDAELKSAQANIASKKYIAAFDDLNKAKKAITQLISVELASVLPAKMGEMEMADQQGGGMEREGVKVDKVYRKPVVKAGNSESSGSESPGEGGMAVDPAMMGTDMGTDMGGEKQEQVSVTITTNMMMASEVMNAHSMSEGEMGGSEESKAVRIKGYRALLKTFGGGDGPYSQPVTEVAMAIVGGAYISVEARGLAEKGQAEKFMNLIDFVKLKGIVGE